MTVSGEASRFPAEAGPRQLTPISVETVLDTQPVSARQIGVVVLCLIVVALDGLDLAILGFLAPAIRAEMHTAPRDLALLFSCGLLGLCVGALTSGPLADRFGRKRVLLAAVVIFGIMGGGCALASSFTMLVVLRTLTGIGLGAAAPNAITLTSEYIPKLKRSFAVTAMFCGFTLGSALGGTVVVPLLTPHVGWRGTLAFIAVLSLLTLPFLALYLPESLKYLIGRRPDSPETARLLQKMFPRLVLGDRVLRPEPSSSTASPLRQLFSDRMRPYTLLLWFSFFLSLFIVYLFGNWLPSVVFDKGLTVGAAAVVVGCFQVGGTAGAPFLGFCMDRFPPARVLSLAYLVGAVSIACMGASFPSKVLTSLCMFGAGVGVSASVTGLNALASQVYPTSSRATGVAWGLGIGRIGSILGSAGGAWIFSKAFSLQTSFAMVAVVAVAIAAGLWLFGTPRARPDATATLPE